jgi:biopolymer transport protein ExbD
MKIRKDKEETTIPTASMADIAFLLIIFFMVTTVFSATKGLDFKLPKEEEDQQLETETIEAAFIKVMPGGSVLVDRTPMALEQILPYLQPKLERWPDKPVILYTDPEADYQEAGPEADRHARAEHRRADTQGGRYLHLDLRVQPVRLTLTAHGCHRSQAVH